MRLKGASLAGATTPILEKVEKTRDQALKSGRTSDITNILHRDVLRFLHAPSAISLSVRVESCSIVVDRGNPVRYGICDG